MGKKLSKLEDELEGDPHLVDFLDKRFSHNGMNEYFETIGISVNNYRPTHISVAYVEHKDEDKRLHLTELKLVREASRKGCSFVTNADYIRLGIAATGWILKK